MEHRHGNAEQAIDHSLVKYLFVLLMRSRDRSLFHFYMCKVIHGQHDFGVGHGRRLPAFNISACAGPRARCGEHRHDDIGRCLREL